MPADDNPVPAGQARWVIWRFSRDLFVLIAGLTVCGAMLTRLSPLRGIVEADEAAGEWLVARRADQATDWARTVSNLGDTLPVVVLLAFVTAVVAATRRWRATLFVPLAMLAEISTFLAVNHIVRRPRPDLDKIGPIPGTFSFPSGHIAATFVCWVGTALVLYVYGHRRAAAIVAIPGMVLAAAIGWARVYLGMHHVLDVVFGLLMGVGALWIAVDALDVSSFFSGDMGDERRQERAAAEPLAHDRSDGGDGGISHPSATGSTLQRGGDPRTAEDHRFTSA
ncbi:MAG: phosphatase PAP2 family protein [Acidimicrobiia bacterium]